MGEALQERRWSERRMTIAVVVAVVAGIVLAAGFFRFDALHGEFLSSNSDSVHGARALLKARHFIALAEERLQRAADGQDPSHLARAAEALQLAENYSAEGNDADPLPRQQLTSRLHDLHQRVAHAAVQEPAVLAELARQTRQLANDFEGAELERWGMLSSLNGELATRMGDLRLLIGGLIGGLVVVLPLLGRALLITRRTQEELRQAKGEIEATQQTTLDASPIGIVYVDAANPLVCRMVKVNRQMSRFFGWPAEQLVGRPLCDLLADPDDGAGAAAAARLEAGEIVQREVRGRRQDGAVFWCAYAGKAVDPADPSRGVVWTLEDIDARKRAEQQLREAREQAELAQSGTRQLLAITADAAAVHPETAAAPAARERFDGRILLVDDSPLVLEASRGMLESLGLEVIAVDSGQQALTHCGRDDIDLVLLDCRMPGLDGFATAQAWRQREGGLRRTAIIAVSAELDAADSERLRQSEMDDFLPKPYNVPKLAALLRQWLAPAR